MTIVLKLKIDTSVCSVMEYFEIFLTKMLMCAGPLKSCSVNSIS
jgi:hypothetical protein